MVDGNGRYARDGHIQQQTQPKSGQMERRKNPRRRVLKKGSIQFGASAIDCRVRNVSSVGAMLDVESPVVIPVEFVLVVPVDDMRMRCRIIWAKQNRLGVEFQ